MTESETIERLYNMKNKVDVALINSKYEKGHWLYDDVQRISDTLQMAIKALEKQIPNKPINNKHAVRISDTAVKFVDWWKCGNCNGNLIRQFVCCPYCQTVIDWSVEE